MLVLVAYYVTSMGAAVEFIDTTYATKKEEEDCSESEKEQEKEEKEQEKGAEDYRIEMLNIEDAKLKEKELGEAAVNHLGE